MKGPEIRKLYQPSQPTVTQTGADVQYKEVAPHQALQNSIYCYWELKTIAPLSSDFIYRVVADGCIDILFELDKPKNNFVTGLSTSYIEFPLAPSFHYLGIRFLPTGFPQLFNVKASELTNRFEELGAINPEIAHFIATQFDESMSLGEITPRLDGFFLKLQASVSSEVDGRFYQAFETILASYGNVSIEKGLDTGISPRQLRRLFEFYIGDSAKTFSKIVRFQQLLYAKPSTARLRKEKLFYDVGYYDQAHFIKEFKTLFGTTPSKAFEP
ncbi:MAG: AraC family transcriptional regulator [Roseivirga sp.]|nr:AraC family transcriptional regulator [Roseivirga sp.]